MKSPAQPTWDYRIISLSCARRQRRAHDPEETAGPGHGCLASGLQVTRAARPRGGPGRNPASARCPGAATTGARQDTRQPGQSPLRTALGHESGSLERLRAARAAPGKARASSGPGGGGRGRVPSAATARRDARPVLGTGRRQQRPPTRDPPAAPRDR